MTHTRRYYKGEVEAEGFPVAEVSDALDMPGRIVWVDLCGPTMEQLHELAEELGLHELAVEDALSAHQRSKLDHYATHLFLSTHALRLARTDMVELRSTEVDAFISDRWLITVRKDPGFDIESVTARWDASPDLARYDVPFLVYGLLDVVVDQYFDVVAAFEEFYDGVSDVIFTENPIEPRHQRHWFEMRRALMRFHKLAYPMRETVSGLMRRENERPGIPDGLRPYFQDVYDHILRVVEATDTLQHLVSSIVEANLSLRDYRQNQVMKKVTSWAAIIAVPTLITGWFGMNVPYPASGEVSGVVVAALLIVACSTALYVVFKKKGWL